MGRGWTLLAVVGTVGLLLAGCTAPGGSSTAPRPVVGAPAAATAPAAQGGPTTGAPAAASQPPPPLVEVRAGLLPSILSAPLFAGVDLGIYRQNGLEVSIEPFTVTSDIMTLLGGGRLEFGQVTMGAAAFNAFNRGVDLTMAGAGSVGIVHLVVRKDLYDSGAVRSVRDLKGTRFALNGRGVIIEYSMFKILEKGGLTPEDVEIPILPWPDQITALGNRAIDVGLMGDPLATLAAARGVGVIVEEREPGQPEPWFAPGLQGGMIMMNRPWAETNPAVATAIVKSYVQAARRLQGSRILEDAEALASVEKWVNVTPEVAKSGAPPLWAINGRVHVETLMDAQRYFIETGGTDYRQPMPLERIYNDRYLTEALREIGTVPEN